MKFLTSFILSLFICNITLANNYKQHYLRGDANIQFQWRLGYSEYTSNNSSQTDIEDIIKGNYSWYDGFMWSNTYLDWENRSIHGVSLLFRGGSPYARSVRCISDLVPFDKAGYAKTFVIPICYNIGSEERLSFALSVIGQEKETIVMNLYPQKEITITSGNLKVSFHTLQVIPTKKDRPLTRVMGLLYVRAYPSLLKYGNRMIFEFNSLTHHMDIESSMSIGSLWTDMSQTNIDEVWTESGLTENKLNETYKLHLESLNKWNDKIKNISKELEHEGIIEIDCSKGTTLWNRGECNVQAYSGNPVKDYQYGKPTDKIKEMAISVTKGLGRKFGLFRYQHHQLPWLKENPLLLDSTDIIYMDQWLKAATATSDKVMLDLQISPITKAYKIASKMGTISLPEKGIPGFSWEDITCGYETTIRHAKKICPNLTIIQMPYEYDNISSNECHKDAHYNIFKCLYKAVNRVNKELSPENQLEVAGLGSNTPYYWDFIEGFLKRYKADNDPEKRLDYITWHTYLFPGSSPNIAKGFETKLVNILEKYNLPKDLRVIIDETGLAEPSTIEDLSDMVGAYKKEAAMACFSSTIQYWYINEGKRFLPIIGGGFHFGLLTYGQQNILSPNTKGMILRNSLYDHILPSYSTPCNKDGYGLYGIGTVDNKEQEYRVLVWTASPSIFYENAKELSFPNGKIVLKHLPKTMEGKNVDIEIKSIDPNEDKILKILQQEKCQTLPLTRGAERYYINFTPEETEILNSINAESNTLTIKNRELTIPLNIKQYSTYLLNIKISK